VPKTCRYWRETRGSHGGNIRDECRERSTRSAIKHTIVSKKAHNARIEDNFYNQRWMSESNFSLLKRDDSKKLRFQTWHGQFRELTRKCTVQTHRRRQVVIHRHRILIGVSPSWFEERFNIIEKRCMNTNLLTAINYKNSNLNMMNKYNQLKNIIKQRGISAGMSAIKNKLRWEYHRKFCDDQYIRVDMFGYDMYLDLYNGGISSTLAMWGIREPGAVSIVQEELCKGDTAIDIGSNIGFYSLLMSSMVQHTGTIYAIEPYPRTFKLLKKNIYMNKIEDRFKLFNIAVSDCNGTEKLYIDKRDNLNRIDNVSKKEYEGHTCVKSRRLDDIVEDNPEINFIRMDLEGFEETILSPKCSGKITSKHKPKILFEAHSNYTTQMQESLDYLFNIGYSPTTIITAYNSRPEELVNKGYSPAREFRDQNLTVGLYKNISNEDIFELLSPQNPHVIRDVLLT